MKKSPSLQALRVGALALRGPGVSELKYYSGAGSRRSGGSGALSKRDGAGLLEVTPIPLCYAAPTLSGLRSFSEFSPAPRALPRPTQIWPALAAGLQMRHGAQDSSTVNQH